MEHHRITISEPTNYHIFQWPAKADTLLLLCTDEAWQDLLSAAAAADEGASVAVGAVTDEGPVYEGAVMDDGAVGAPVLLCIYYPIARQNHQLLW